jgi:hypothetical protein
LIRSQASNKLFLLCSRVNAGDSSFFSMPGEQD